MTLAIDREQETKSVVSERLQELSNELQDLLNGEAPNPLAELIFNLATVSVEEKDLEVFANGKDSSGKPVICKSRLTEDIIRGVANLILEGHGKMEANKVYGISQDLYKRYLFVCREAMKKFKADESYEFSPLERLCLTWREAMKNAERLSEVTLLKKVQAGAEEDWRAAAHLLGRRFPDRWGKGREQSQVNVSGHIQVQNTGVLAVAPVAGNIEDWQRQQTTQEVIDPSKVLTLPLQEADSDDIEDDD